MVRQRVAELKRRLNWERVEGKNGEDFDWNGKCD
jgi:hypothetical protein